MKRGTIIASFRAGDLPALVEYWKRAFSGHRNALPVSEDLLRARIVERATAVERFEPEGMLLAREGNAIVGALHCGVLDETSCRILNPAWEGGERGWVGLLHVLPGCRRRGLGGALWSRAMERLRPCRTVFLDGEGLNPFYGNSSGPETPLFGTPEGIGLDAADAETIGFLERRGHRPKARGVTLEWTPGGKPWSPDPPDAGAEFRVLADEFPELGAPPGSPGRAERRAPFFAVVAIAEGMVAGSLVAYEMSELRQDRWGIYTLAVLEPFQGRGWGRTLLARALAEVRRRRGRACEVVTLPEVSKEAVSLYRSAGFVPRAEWTVYGVP